MNLLNYKIKPVTIDWSSITLPLLAGTPIAADGTISNDGDAIGLVIDTITVKPLFPSLYILIAGDIDESDIEYDDLDDAAIAAMGGIRIFDENGALVVPEEADADEEE